MNMWHSATVTSLTFRGEGFKTVGVEDEDLEGHQGPKRGRDALQLISG